ncbi:uncharacterized protein A4U43_C07F2930 [Asparagus officinalis]|uniref:Uncharacterized protein n=1 Tax=Asparagus officinalis TaxID=4686 RepID=A0A5P1E8X0_ASPOF|nr:uncharacterized protein LOC109850569 [Asparagus officinalis]ONK62345.1 uncharacterized protein A4U43_C07F2930 [Asparagus officinalis]
MLDSSPQSNFRGETMGKGEGDGIRTVECLRGRLLAERVASKAAKDEADLMAKRLDELEKQLAEEIKFRDRAEKRLNYALKKLKSLNLSNRSESSAGSLESWKADSGTVDSSGQCGSGEEGGERRRSMGVKDVEGDDGVDSYSGDSTNKMGAFDEGSWSSVGTGNSWIKEWRGRDEDKSGKDHEESVDHDSRQPSHNVNEQNKPMHQDEHSNDMLALVPLKSMLPSSNPRRSDFNGDNVQNALVALRNVKEKLRTSMERKKVLLYPTQKRFMASIK